MDCIQLCAQVLCLEEMLDIEIEEAFLWYWQTRRRESVSVDYYLRKLTIETVKFLIFLCPVLPKPVYEKCNSCSLFDLCQPKHPMDKANNISRTFQDG